MWARGLDPQKFQLERSQILDSRHFLTSFSWFSNLFFYDLIFVFSTLTGKREYFEDKKCTKLTPEELKAIALMSLVTLKKNSIRS